MGARTIPEIKPAHFLIFSACSSVGAFVLPLSKVTGSKPSFCRSSQKNFLIWHMWLGQLIKTELFRHLALLGFIQT